MHEPELRRQFLRFGALSAAALVWSDPLEATPECDETDDNIEGPFYKAGAPDRSTLVDRGMPGLPLIVTGRVLSTQCKPLAGAVLDVWQCDANGVYDNKGYTLRGKLHSDDKGRYEIRTILPPPYNIGDSRFRPAHIHLKISAPGTPVLTTQLYFDGDKYNTVDRAFRKSLALRPKEAKGGKLATFDFHIKTAS